MYTERQAKRRGFVTSRSYNRTKKSKTASYEARVVPDHMDLVEEEKKVLALVEEAVLDGGGGGGGVQLALTHASR